MRPNLFRFATSELSQDAFLGWLLSWAAREFVADNPALHQVAKRLLDEIYLKSESPPPNQYTKIEIRKQEAGIDILCIVNNSDAIIIEDKVGTQQHSQQLCRYKCYVSKDLGFAKERIFPIYVQTGDQSDYSEVERCGYKVLTRFDILTILESKEARLACQSSDILTDFAQYLRAIEDDVQSFSSLPLEKWSWNAWKGFYAQLQQALTEGHWDYVANQSGGFLAYYYDSQGDAECGQYLQLEHYLQREQTKFCFKIWVQDQPF